MCHGHAGLVNGQCEGEIHSRLAVAEQNRQRQHLHGTSMAHPTNTVSTVLQTAQIGKLQQDTRQSDPPRHP